MNRFFASALTLSLGISVALAPTGQAQTGQAQNSSNSKTNSNTDPVRGVARITPENESKSGTSNNMSSGMMNQEQKGAQLPQFSGNLPNTINDDRTHGVNAPGTMIGPSPENGQPDPRFPNSPGSSGGGNDINAKSAAGGAAQAPTGADKMQGAGQTSGQTGGTTSNLNEGLPSASMDNSGATSTQGSGGTGGGAGGTETNVGGDAAPGKGAAQSVNGSSNVAAESRGAFPYVAGAIGFIAAMFLGTMVWARAKRNR